MKKLIPLAIIAILLISVVSATTLTENPRPVNKFSYTMEYKIFAPFKILLGKETQLSILAKKQALLAETNIIDDKEYVLNDLDKDIKRLSKSKKPLIVAGAKLTNESIQKDRDEIHNSFDETAFFTEFQSVIKQRETTLEWQNFASSLNGDVQLYIGERPYILKFDNGIYNGFSQGISDTASYIIHLGYGNAVRIYDDMRHREWNKMDSELAPLLPPKLQYKLKDSLKVRLGEQIRS